MLLEIKRSVLTTVSKKQSVKQNGTRATCPVTVYRIFHSYHGDFHYLCNCNLLGSQESTDPNVHPFNLVPMREP